MISWIDRTVLYALDDGSGRAEGSLAPHTDFVTSEPIALEAHELLRVRMPVVASDAPVSYGLCFYDSALKLLKNRGVTMPWGTVKSSADVLVYIPGEAAFFRVSYWRGAAAPSCPSAPPFAFSCEAYSEEDRPFTHSLPTSVGMNNALKRARQLTDIRWTPRTDVPRYCMAAGEYSGQGGAHFLDWCKAGKEYVGIPYSGSGEPDRNTKRINPETFCGKWGYYKFHVGIDVDFETFLTACRYPDSIFGERSGQQAPDFDSSPYGTYCSALVGCALGWSQPLPKVIEFGDSDNFLKISGSLPDLSPEELGLCDVLLFGAYHVALITDLIRDGSGKVTGIEVSEATTVGNDDSGALYSGLGGLCRRKLWQPEDFFSWFRKYSLFRVRSFQGISYVKSPFVNVGNETGDIPSADYPLIPYLGSGARYRKEHIVNDSILIGASGFTELVIEKDGEPFRTVPIAGLRSVHGGFREVGSYAAYLTDGLRRSAACRWTVE